jgi:hypothetical protein
LDGHEHRHVLHAHVHGRVKRAQPWAPLGEHLFSRTLRKIPNEKTHISYASWSLHVPKKNGRRRHLRVATSDHIFERPTQGPDTKTGIQNYCKHLRLSKY